MLSNGRDMTKCQFLHDDNNDDTKAIAIPRVFSGNIRGNDSLSIILSPRGCGFVIHIYTVRILFHSLTKPAAVLGRRLSKCASRPGGTVVSVSDL